MLQNITGHRAAGILFLAAALSEYLILGNIRFIQAGLGLALLLVQETAKADLLRLGVFCWVGFSLIMVAAAGIASSAWLYVLPAILFGAGLVGLMLERLTQQQIAIFSAISVSGLAISWLF